MGDLSENFSLKEFSCKCNCDKGKTIISAKLIENLQQLRSLINVPIIIISGYRCLKHNIAVGGFAASKHLSGAAADICFPTMFHGKIANVIEMYLLAEEMCDFRNGGIGLNLAANSLHVDIRDKRARWVLDHHGKHISIKQWVMGDKDGH